MKTLKQCNSFDIIILIQIAVALFQLMEVKMFEQCVSNNKSDEYQET